MSNTPPPVRDAIQKAAAFVTETRKEYPSRSLYSILDEAGMRFNLTPLDSEALSSLFRASSGGAN